MTIHTWFDTVLAAADRGESADGIAFPATGIQELYVGRSGADAIKEVIPFAQIILPQLKKTSKVIDFGVGWGRIARLLVHTVEHNNLILADVAEQALKLCEQCNVPGVPLKLDAAASVIPLRSNYFDYIYAYSVFSHISEKAALSWLNEFHRVLKPGGRSLITVLGARYLDLVVACNQKQEPNEFERRIGTHLGQHPYLRRESYQKGEFVFEGKKSGEDLSADFYGWAAMPISWFERTFETKFRIVRVIDDPSKFEQVVVEIERI